MKEYKNTKKNCEEVANKIIHELNTLPEEHRVKISSEVNLVGFLYSCSRKSGLEALTRLVMIKVLNRPLSEDEHKQILDIFKDVEA